MATEPLPCPFCGSTNIRAHVYGGGEPDAFMQCHDCSADGPNGLNREGAIEAWNRRTQPAQVPTLSEAEVESICRMGAVYAPDGKVTRHPNEYRMEIENAKRGAVRKAEAALIAKWSKT